MGAESICTILKDDFSIPEVNLEPDVLCDEIDLLEINRFLYTHFENLKEMEEFWDFQDGQRIFRPVRECSKRVYEEFLIFKKQVEICKSGICNNGEFCKVLERDLSFDKEIPFVKVVSSYRPHLSFSDYICNVRMGYLERVELKKMITQREFRTMIRPYERKYGSFDSWNHEMVRYLKNKVFKSRERRKFKLRKK